MCQTCQTLIFRCFQVLFVCTKLSMNALLWCWISKPCWLLSGQHLILQWIVVVWWMQPGIKLGTQVGLNSSLASLLSHRPFPFWEMQSHSPLTKGFVFIEKFYLAHPFPLLDLYSRSTELGRLQYSVELFWKTRMCRAWGRKRVEGWEQRQVSLSQPELVRCLNRLNMQTPAYEKWEGPLFWTVSVGYIWVDQCAKAIWTQKHIIVWYFKRFAVPREFLREFFGRDAVWQTEQCVLHSFSVRTCL